MNKNTSEQLAKYDIFIGKHFDCGEYFNWDCGRFRYCRYAILNGVNHYDEGEWIRTFKPFEVGNMLVGFVHTEEPNDYFIQIDPRYKYLEKEMLDYCIDNAKHKDSSRKSIVLTASSTDFKRIRLFEEYGGKKLSWEDYRRVGEISSQIEIAENILSKNRRFSVKQLAVTNSHDIDELVRVYHDVWNDCNYFPTKNTPIRILEPNASGVNFIWGLYDENNYMIGFTCGFGNADNSYIDLYPITVQRGFIDTNAITVLLSKAIVDSKDNGYNYTTLSAIYEPKEENYFKEIGFKMAMTEYFYEIPII